MLQALETWTLYRLSFRPATNNVDFIDILPEQRILSQG